MEAEGGTSATQLVEKGAENGQGLTQFLNSDQRRRNYIKNR
jgi:hypothetical protein